MNNFHNLINLYQQTREGIEWELWFLGLYPAKNTVEWIEKLKQYQKMKAS